MVPAASPAQRCGGGHPLSGTDVRASASAILTGSRQAIPQELAASLRPNGSVRVDPGVTAPRVGPAAALRGGAASPQVDPPNPRRTAPSQTCLLVPRVRRNVAGSIPRFSQPVRDRYVPGGSPRKQRAAHGSEREKHPPESRVPGGGRVSVFWVDQVCVTRTTVSPRGQRHVSALMMASSAEGPHDHERELPPPEGVPVGPSTLLHQDVHALVRQSRCPPGRVLQEERLLRACHEVGTR